MRYNQSNILRQTLLELHSPHIFNEHYGYIEHEGYRYWKALDRQTGQFIYKKRQLPNGKPEPSTEQEFHDIQSQSPKTAPKQQQKQAQAGHIASAKSKIQGQTAAQSGNPFRQFPKPTRAEFKQFTEDRKVPLTTKSGKPFKVDIEGSSELWQSVFRASRVSPSHILSESLGSFVDVVSPDNIYATVGKDSGKLSLYIKASLLSKSGKEQIIARSFLFDPLDKSLEVNHEKFFIND